jgi:hypothetical protein
MFTPIRSVAKVSSCPSPGVSVPRGFPGVSGVVSGTVDLGTTNVVKWEVAADAKHRISGMHRHVIGVDSHRSWLPIG